MFQVFNVSGTLLYVAPAKFRQGAECILLLQEAKPRAKHGCNFFPARFLIFWRVYRPFTRSAVVRFTRYPYHCAESPTELNIGRNSLWSSEVFRDVDTVRSSCWTTSSTPSLLVSRTPIKTVPEWSEGLVVVSIKTMYAFNTWRLNIAAITHLHRIFHSSWPSVFAA